MKIKPEIVITAGIIGAILFYFFKKDKIAAPNYLNRTGLPRGIKNNNPLNIILTNIDWKGKISKEENSDQKFEQFQNIAYGYRAAGRNLDSYYRTGKNTIRKLIDDWNEGPDDNYIAFVSNKLGIAPDTAINLNSIKPKLIEAMALFENGTSAAPYIDIKTIERALKIA